MQLFGLVGIPVATRRESPRAIDEGTDADAVSFVVEKQSATDEILEHGAGESRIGVRGADALRDIDGAHGEVTHGRRVGELRTKGGTYMMVAERRQTECRGASCERWREHGGHGRGGAGLEKLPPGTEQG